MPQLSAAQPSPDDLRDYRPNVASMNTQTLSKNTYGTFLRVIAGPSASIVAVDCLTWTRASKLHGSTRSCTFVNNENSAQPCQCTGKRSVPLDSRAQHKRRVAVQREILVYCLLCPSKSMSSRRPRQQEHAKISSEAAWRSISVCRSMLREEKPSSGMYLRHSSFCAVRAAATPA